MKLTSVILNGIVRWLIRSDDPVLMELNQPAGWSVANPLASDMSISSRRTRVFGLAPGVALITGTHGTETWWGNRSSELRKEAAFARNLLKHHLKRVREWAKIESESREHLADLEDREHAERGLD